MLSSFLVYKSIKEVLTEENCISFTFYISQTHKNSSNKLNSHRGNVIDKIIEWSER